MNWPKSVFLKIIIAVAIVAGLGCGVKGDPLPPEKPVELGRGRPTYKRATEGIKIEKKVPVKKEEEDEDDEHEEL